MGKTEEEKGTTEDEKVGWHHRLDGHEFEPGTSPTLPQPAPARARTLDTATEARMP